MQPPLAVLYPKGIPVLPFQEFANSLNKEDISVHLEERELGGPFAGIVWTMLTGAAVFISSAYIGGMLKELGKDHYEILKNSLAKLSVDTMNTPKIEPVLFGTAGKVMENDPISMAFSVWAQVLNGRTVKLLLPKNTGKIDYASATNAFLDFVIDCNERGEIALLEAGFDVSKKGNPITVIYNPQTSRIEWINPLPH